MRMENFYLGWSKRPILVSMNILPEKSIRNPWPGALIPVVLLPKSARNLAIMKRFLHVLSIVGASGARRISGPASA